MTEPAARRRLREAREEAAGERSANVPADLMRAAELAAYEALKEDHREPSALWGALVHRAVAAVLPWHEQQVREQIAAGLDEQARKEAYRDIDGPYCKEARTFTRAAQLVRAGKDEG